MKKLSLALAAIMLLSLVSGCSMLPQSAPVQEENLPEEIPAYVTLPPKSSRQSLRPAKSWCW